MSTLKDRYNSKMLKEASAPSATPSGSDNAEKAITEFAPKVKGIAPLEKATNEVLKQIQASKSKKNKIDALWPKLAAELKNIIADDGIRQTTEMHSAIEAKNIEKFDEANKLNDLYDDIKNKGGGGTPLNNDKIKDLQQLIDKELTPVLDDADEESAEAMANAFMTTVSGLFKKIGLWMKGKKIDVDDKSMTLGKILYSAAEAEIEKKGATP